MSPPKKRTLEQVRAGKESLCEPPQGPEQARDFADGLAHFQRQEYWQAHECWEGAWRRMGNAPQDDGEIVLRGLIQLAAALHAQEQGRTAAAALNLAKAREKLGVLRGHFWGVNIPALCLHLDMAATPAALTGLVLPE